MIDVVVGLSAFDLACRVLTGHRLVVNSAASGGLRLEPPLVVSDSEIDEELTRLKALA